jgi:hypothetical protein
VYEEASPVVRKFRLSLLAAAPIIAVSAVGTACAAASWELMEWTGPVTVSVDTSSIARHAARITASVLWDYAATQTAPDGEGAPYKSMIGVVVFDCTTEQFGGAGSVSYSGDGGGGKAVAQFSINPDKATLSAPAPGSVGHDLLAFVCGLAKKPPPG